MWRCDTTFFKSDISHKLSIAPDDPGAFHLHSNEGGILEQYAREMCAEIWDDEKEGWENPSGKDNHFWDCEVMALALAFIERAPHAQTGGKPSGKTPAPSGTRYRQRTVHHIPEVIMPVYDLSERLNWKQACTLLGYKKDKFYRLISEGKLSSYGVGKRFRWVRRSNCERLLVDAACSEEVATTCHSLEDSL